MPTDTKFASPKETHVRGLGPSRTYGISGVTANTGDDAQYGLKDSGNREVFETGAVRDTRQGKGRFDLLPFDGLQRLAQVFERGCLKYGERNWEAGMPVSRYLDSALRHTHQYIAGYSDEDHLGQAAWNLLCALATEERAERGTLSRDLLLKTRNSYIGHKESER